MSNAIFVVGVGRSGTTLVQSMLDAHPDITMLPEIHFVRFYLGRRRRYIERKGVRFFQKLLVNDEAFGRSGVDPDVLLRPYLSGESSFELELVYRRLLELYRTAEAKRHIGEKDARYIDYLEVIHNLLPASRILHIIRDPRDVVLSRSKAAWSAHRPFWLNALVYRAQLAHGRRAGKNLFGDNYLELRYEALIEEPSAVMRIVCKHIGVDYSERVIRDFQYSAQRLADESEMQWKQNTMGSLLRSNKEKWRSALSPWHIALTEAICRQSFRELGYQRANAQESLSFLQRRLLQLIPICACVFSLLYRIVVRFDLMENRRGAAFPNLRVADTA